MLLYAAVKQQMHLPMSVVTIMLNNEVLRFYIYIVPLMTGTFRRLEVRYYLLLTVFTDVRILDLVDKCRLLLMSQLRKSSPQERMS